MLYDYNTVFTGRVKLKIAQYQINKEQQCGCSSIEWTKHFDDGLD